MGEFQDFPSATFSDIVPSKESFTVTINSSTEKVWIRGVGVSRYSVKKISHTVQKTIVEESSTVAVMSGTGKVWI